MNIDDEGRFRRVACREGLSDVQTNAQLLSSKNDWINNQNVCDNTLKYNSKTCSLFGQTTPDIYMGEGLCARHEGGIEQLADSLLFFRKVRRFVDMIYVSKHDHRWHEKPNKGKRYVPYRTLRAIAACTCTVNV